MKNVNEEIEKTLQSLEGMEAASPKPFFYTRLKARMENAQAVVPPQVRWALKPAFVFGILSVILILNVVSAVNYSRHLNQNQASISNQQTLEGFAKEYSLDAN